MDSTGKRVYTSGEVCKIAGIEDNMLDRWTRMGILKPIVNGTGKGYHRRFTLCQVLALYHGMKLKKANCSLAYVLDTIRYIEQLSEQELMDNFVKGLVVVYPLPKYIGPSIMIGIDNSNMSINKQQIPYNNNLADLRISYSEVINKIDGV